MRTGAEAQGWLEPPGGLDGAGRSVPPAFSGERGPAPPRFQTPASGAGTEAISDV